jgi:hypothetical protein
MCLAETFFLICDMIAEVVWNCRELIAWQLTTLHAPWCNVVTWEYARRLLMDVAHLYCAKLQGEQSVLTVWLVCRMWCAAAKEQLRIWSFYRGSRYRPETQVPNFSIMALTSYHWWSTNCDLRSDS